MFTGIVEEIGRIQALRMGSQEARIAVGARFVTTDLKIGDSVAVNGVCLTVVESDAGGFSCDLSRETLDRSNLRKARAGMVVNLERALAVGARLGGHFVLGHVDGVGRFGAITPNGAGAILRIEFPSDLEKYLVYKGSVAVDGVSLTLASLDSRSFTIAVIPHTLKSTNLGQLRPGDSVNLETDILGKFMDRFFQLGLDSNRNSKWTLEYFKERGF